MDTQNVLCSYNGMLFNSKKERNGDANNNTGEF